MIPYPELLAHARYLRTLTAIDDASLPDITPPPVPHYKPIKVNWSKVATHAFISQIKSLIP